MSRRNEAHRLEQTRAIARARRLQNLRDRESPVSYMSPGGSHPEDEPANKRRRKERSGQVEMEHLPMELMLCDGGLYDGPRARDFSPECALRDDESGMSGPVVAGCVR